MRVVDVSPVVAGVGLAFVHQDCVKSVRDLGKNQMMLRCIMWMMYFMSGSGKMC